MKRFGKKNSGSAAGFSVPALLIAAVLVCSALSMSIFRVVTVNGVEVLSSRSRSAIESTVAQAEEKASAVLGRDFTFGDSLQTSVRLRIVSASAAYNTDSLLDCVDGIAKLAVLQVNGESVAASEDEAECARAIELLKQRYTAENTVYCEIQEELTVTRQYIRKELNMTAEEMAELLDPANGGSHAVTVKTADASLVTEEIPFESETVYNDSLYTDQSEILTVGVNGQKQVTEYSIKINGEETSVERGGEEILAEPVSQVTSVGTKPGKSTDSKGCYIWPAEGTITSYFGYRSYYIGSSYHKGIDILGEEGQSILAADGGEVVCAEYVTGYGNFIQILHDNGEMTCYGHLSGFAVSAGERVYQGQLIGYMGETGTAGAVHLHFELRQDGKQVDPMPFLPE